MIDQDSTEADVITTVREFANQVDDPCGLAHNVAIGMVDMGLVRKISASPATDRLGWDVTVTLRFTSPGCFYFSYFEDQLSLLLKSESKIRLSFLWDETLDWTPESLSPSAREKLNGIKHGLAFVDSERKKGRETLFTIGLQAKSGSAGPEKVPTSTQDAVVTVQRGRRDPEGKLCERVTADHE